MTDFEFPPSIDSRPVYGKLETRPGHAHLFIADAEGAAAILDFAAANADIMANSHIIYIPKDCGEKYVAQLEALNASQLYVGPSYPAAMSRINHVLATAHMGIQLYLAGTEGLMSETRTTATNAGVSLDSIQLEHRGSLSRRMQCVHCKGITENVITDPYVCSHCGLNLFVRDHYSERLGVFQGVRVDAEDHGNVPDAVELYK